MNRTSIALITCLMLVGCGGGNSPSPLPSADQIRIEMPGKDVLNIPVPATISVYQAPITPITTVQAKAQAALFGLSGPTTIDAATETIFIQKGDESCEFDIAVGTSYYQNAASLQATGSDIVVPGLEESKKIAQDYLQRFSLAQPGSPAFFGADEYPGEAGNVIQRQIVYRRLLDDRFAVGQGSQFSVTLGNGGKVIECFIDWPTLQPKSTVKLQSPESALGTLNQKLKEITLFDPKHAYRSFKITSIKLVYYGQYTANNQRELIPAYGIKGLADRGEGSFEENIILTAAPEAPVLALSYGNDIKLPD